MRLAGKVEVMTTLIAIDGMRAAETRAQAVARRLRQEIAALDISKSAAAQICGVSQPWMSRRLTGKTPLGVDELDMICGGIKNRPPLSGGCGGAAGSRTRVHPGALAGFRQGVEPSQPP